MELQLGGNPGERPTDFYKTNYDISGWDKVQVPMNWNVVGIQKDGTQKYGTPIYTNQRVIFQHKIAVGDWKGGVMREPRKDWPTFKHRNEVGSYRRTFTVPAEWDGREVYLKLRRRRFVLLPLYQRPLRGFLKKLAQPRFVRHLALFS